MCSSNAEGWAAPSSCCSNSPPSLLTAQQRLATPAEEWDTGAQEGRERWNMPTGAVEHWHQEGWITPTAFSGRRCMLHVGWCTAGEDAYTLTAYCVERGGYDAVDDVRSADVCTSRRRFLLCALQKWILSQVNETWRCYLLHNGPVCLLSFIPWSQWEDLSSMFTKGYNNLDFRN